MIIFFLATILRFCSEGKRGHQSPRIGTRALIYLVAKFSILYHIFLYKLAFFVLNFLTTLLLAYGNLSTFLVSMIESLLRCVAKTKEPHNLVKLAYFEVWQSMARNQTTPKASSCSQDRNIIATGRTCIVIPIGKRCHLVHHMLVFFFYQEPIPHRNGKPSQQEACGQDPCGLRQALRR